MKSMEQFFAHLDLAKKAHSVSYWTGIVGVIVLLLNQALGIKLDQTQFVSAAGILASVVIGGHYSAGKLATSIAAVASIFAQNNAPVPTLTPPPVTIHTQAVSVNPVPAVAIKPDAPAPVAKGS